MSKFQVEVFISDFPDTVFLSSTRDNLIKKFMESHCYYSHSNKIIVSAEAQTVTLKKVKLKICVLIPSYSYIYSLNGSEYKNNEKMCIDINLPINLSGGGGGVQDGSLFKMMFVKFFFAVL